MANLKISSLSELAVQPADDDVLAIVDTSDTTDAATGTTKKVQISNAIKNSSTTVKGVMEEATQVEVDEGTAAGGTSARLAVNPSTIRAKAYHDYAADAGLTDAYAITVSPAITAYATGQVFTFKANTLNTGACTLAVCGLSAINIKKNVSTELEIGDILANQIVTVVYDGANMQMQSKSSLNIEIATIYTANDTWTKPAGITFVEVVCIGGGGGGAGGGGGGAGTIRGGGCAGGAGAITIKIMRASDVTTNVSVTVGVGGNGGAGGTAAVGSNGASGTLSSFGTYLYANPGLPGAAFTGAGGAGGSSGVGITTSPTNGIAGQGGAGSPAAASPVAGSSAEFGGSGGGSSSNNATAVASAGGSSLFGAAGGGGGGSLDAANAYRQPAAGGAHQSYSAGGGGATGSSAATSTPGTAGTSRSGTGCGDGGGGGGSDGDSTGSVGGAGGAPGGGGGGAGGGTNVGGAGGAGGVGEVRVFCW